MWKYQELLNTNIQILIAIAVSLRNWKATGRDDERWHPDPSLSLDSLASSPQVGFSTVLLGALDQKTDIHAVNKVVFYILLPSAVLFALGLNTNLRDGNVWRFVGGFLLLRAICLLLIWAFHGLVRRQSLAYVTIQWMVTCWVSTVVLGIPLLIATLVGIDLDRRALARTRRTL